ncbi:toll/interleukin-1 receptor domain-containing protein [Piscinibacter defluvii]|uniref:toll/interleukin-1 receptor domain-containing protein n=1 Tax=Piscinibacter defluvii TaxID=1796922 RepID=UPI000FDD2F71|nr:toll/interleukin-1 receptor domain-containing protein [Piscinibacter defluvii]
MPQVFISYVRENTAQVERLRTELQSHGIRVWLDRNDIAPGVYWEDAIRRAIEQGDFFLACFSDEYSARHSTYMNEELHLAIQQLRLRPHDRAWFIPVVLSGAVPDWQIGPGKTLRSLQWAELFEDRWADGLQAIVGALRAALHESPTRCLLLSDGTEYASELGRLAAAAGYAVEAFDIGADDIDEVAPTIRDPYPLLILSRGEHYKPKSSVRFYSRLLDAVTTRGAMLATPWVAFESQGHPELRRVLPFTYTGAGFNEKTVVTCTSVAGSEGAELFPYPIQCRISFELLAPTEDCTVLLESADAPGAEGPEGVPIFGYRSLDDKFIYYLNVCQHACFGSMQSPLKTSPEFFASMDRAFRWLRRRHPC